MCALVACLPNEERDIVLAYLAEGERFESIGRRYGYTDEWARKRFNRAMDAVTRQELLRYRSRRTDPSARQLENDCLDFLRYGVKATMLAEMRRDLPPASCDWQRPLRYGRPPEAPGGRIPGDKIYTPDEIVKYVATRSDLQTEPDLHSEYDELRLAA